MKKSPHPPLCTRDKQRFRNRVYTYYRLHGRRLPWRDTSDPYHILVSEIMLQQTQVSRVVDTYGEFIRLFPTVRVLAAARLGRVMRA
ncbi:MAG: A/G-specific adenine glycosylase, partial [Candidatus Omnitrophica bacterium]|nr:A/G-specific adenine glycosylase [Candidatus Omnitrophota bacterium]